VTVGTTIALLSGLSRLRGSGTGGEREFAVRAGRGCKPGVLGGESSSMKLPVFFSPSVLCSSSVLAAAAWSMASAWSSGREAAPEDAPQPISQREGAGGAQTCNIQVEEVQEKRRLAWRNMHRQKSAVEFKRPACCRIFPPTLLPFLPLVPLRAAPSILPCARVTNSVHSLGATASA
jgi:hypothetical protein